MNKCLLIAGILMILLGCKKEEKIIEIQYVGSRPWKNKISGEKARDVRIYRSDPMDSTSKAIYWLETSSIRDEKLISHVDCGIQSLYIYNRAGYRWVNDSTLSLTFLNSHPEKFTIIKLGNRFSILQDPNNRDSIRILFMEGIPVNNKTVEEMEE